MAKSNKSKVVYDILNERRIAFAKYTHETDARNLAEQRRIAAGGDPNHPLPVIIADRVHCPVCSQKRCRIEDLKCCETCTKKGYAKSSNEYVFAGKSFRSKQAALDYFKDYKRRKKIGDHMEEPYRSVMLSMLKTHPYYDELAPFIRDRTQIVIAMFKDDFAPHFELINDDGSRKEFSYLKCDGRTKISDHRKSVMHLMRNAITDQINEFKHRTLQQTEVYICAIDGVEIDVTEVHVDHVNTHKTFKTLVNEFVTQYAGGDFKNVIISPNPIGDTSRTHVLDAEFVNTWSQYHRDHARLRILCRDHNLSAACR